MRIVPSDRALAAEIRQIDLRDLFAAGFTAIHAAWLDQLVLLFRNQHLTDNDLIAGLPLEEAEALLDELWSRGTRDGFTWHTEWRVGDVVLWGNGCTMHRRDPFDPQSRRILHRTQIKGEHRPSA